jgi:hypothetical protein
VYLLLAGATDLPTDNSLTNWALGGLATVVIAMFAYFKGAIANREKQAESAVDRMIESNQAALDKSDERFKHLTTILDKQLDENARNRDAFLENTGRITHSLEQSTKVQEAIAHRLDRVYDELKKSNPSLGAG